MTIFIPSSPTPFTGYTITVPRKEAIEMPITVEEAIRFAVTGGVLIPPHQVLEADRPDPDDEGDGPPRIQQPTLPVASPNDPG